MSAPDRFTLGLRAWLAEGTRPLSRDVRAAVMEALPELRQDRGSGMLWKVTDRGLADGQHRATGLVLRVAVMVAALVALLAALAVVGQSPPNTSRFAPGSIAFTRSGGLFVAAPDGSEPVPIGGSDAWGDEEFAFSPDRAYLAYIAGDPYPDSELTVVGADGRRLWSQPADDFSTFSWAPGSDELARYTYRTTLMSVSGVDGVTRRTVSLPAPLSDPWLGRNSPTPLAWSPDGQWFAAPFGYKTSGHYIVVASDGSPRAFGQLDGLQQDPGGPFAWAPDSRLALALGSGAEVAVLSAEGDLRTIPLPDGLTAGWMAWSPDGAQLAVSTRGATWGSGRIVVIEDDGASRVLAIDQSALSLTPDIGDIGPVDWSSDGQRMLFMANADQDAPAAAIWSVDLAGGDLQQLVGGVDGYRFDVAGAPNAGGRGR